MNHLSLGLSTHVNLESRDKRSSSSMFWSFQRVRALSENDYFSKSESYFVSISSADKNTLSFLTFFLSRINLLSFIYFPYMIRRCALHSCGMISISRYSHSAMIYRTTSAMPSSVSLRQAYSASFSVSL